MDKPKPLWEIKSPVPPRLSKEQVNELREAMFFTAIQDSSPTSPLLYSVDSDPRPQRILTETVEEKINIEPSPPSPPVCDETEHINVLDTTLVQEVLAEEPVKTETQLSKVGLPFGLQAPDLSQNKDNHPTHSTAVLSPWFFIGGPPRFGEPNETPPDPKERKQLKRNRRQAALDAINEEADASKRSRNNIRSVFAKLQEPL